MPRGDKQQIMNYGIVIPDNEYLLKFKNFAKPILEQTDYNRKENKRLANLRDTLLPKLMNGEIGLSDEELAFYDALTKPEAVKDFYSNEDLVAFTKELTDTLRKNKTIDLQKKESARAKMRILVKRLLKKYKYPPEGL